MVLADEVVTPPTEANDTGTHGNGNADEPDSEDIICNSEMSGPWACEDPEPAAAGPSAGDIERAVRSIAMPRLTLTIQPGGSTLVNVPTIFYTDPTTLRRSITLLGTDIDVVARPSSYTWHHGDGTTHRTSSPGRPYPAKDVTYRYREPGENLRASVDTTYTVEYRVDGGDWTDLGATLTAAGPSTALDVDEAAPVLVRR